MKIFSNARFWHNSSFENQVKAVLTEKGKIKKLLSQIPENLASAEHIDLGGHYVFPGFIDTHTHSFEGGLYSLMIDLSEASSLQDVFDMISSEAGDKGKTVFAWNFDETRVRERRFPTRAELDALIPDRNLVLRRVDGHSCMANSFALKALQQDIPRIKGDAEVFKAQDNDLTVHWFHRKLDDEYILMAYRAAAQIALRGGFTTVHTMVGDSDQSIGHYALLKEHLQAFPIHYILYPQSFNLKAALEVGAEHIGGCILADGSIGSYTAAISEPYCGKEGNGTLYQSDAFWQDFITRAHQLDLQVGVHCIGDRAIDQINRVYMSLAKSDFKDLRHQLIHCEITDDALINQIKASGAVPVMQPVFDQLWGGDSSLYANVLGVERARLTNRFSSFLSRGVTITGSSDWYITPLDIRRGLDAALNHHNLEERLSLTQAVDIYTKYAAWLSHDEKRKGQIEEGFDADFSILSYDPSSAEPLRKVMAVIRNAKIVYDNAQDQ